MISWIVVGLFIGVTALAARRLLLLHRETRGLPELMIAVLIIGVGTLGVGGSFIIMTTLSDGPLRTVLSFLPILGVSVGMSALCVFTWQVYRRDSGIACGSCLAIAFAMAALFVYALAHGNTLVLQQRPIAIASSILYVATMAWSAAEAIRYWRAMTRRLRLGLADPLVTNRFLLWGLATGTAAQGIALGAFARLGMGLEINSEWITLCYAAHGSVAAVCFWLAFQPPERYAGWIQRRAKAS